jgi:hypothetical protein
MTWRTAVASLLGRLKCFAGVGAFCIRNGSEINCRLSKPPQTFCIKIKELRGDAENGRQRVRRPVCQVGFVLFFFGWGGKIALPEKGLNQNSLFDFASVERAAESLLQGRVP